jgi:hypothetical protein
VFDLKEIIALGGTAALDVNGNYSARTQHDNKYEPRSAFTEDSFCVSTYEEC